MSNKGGKGSRAKAKKRRDEAKRAKRTANYLRTGPKGDSKGKKRKNRFVIGPSKWAITPYPRSVAKGKGTKHHEIQGPRKKHPKRPLRPLRQRQSVKVKND